MSPPGGHQYAAACSQAFRWTNRSTAARETARCCVGAALDHAGVSCSELLFTLLRWGCVKPKTPRTPAPDGACQELGIDLKDWFVLPRSCRSVEEETVFCVLNHPFKPFLQVQTCHRRARQNLPLVRANRIQLQSLRRSTAIPACACAISHLTYVLLAHTPGDVALVLEHKQRRSHEALLLHQQYARAGVDMARRTSWSSSPFSSCRQSSNLSRSVASTTQMSVSVFSK